jgi:hypothetical protein
MRTAGQRCRAAYGDRRCGRRERRGGCSPRGHAPRASCRPVWLPRSWGNIPSQEDVTAASTTSKPDTPPGLSGWTHHLLAFVLQVPAFLKALYKLTSKVMLCASRLTPLRKLRGGLRPISGSGGGGGGMIYTLVTQTIIRHSNRPDFLLWRRFGVGRRGGVEPVIRGDTGCRPCSGRYLGPVFHTFNLAGL